MLSLHKIGPAVLVLAFAVLVAAAWMWRQFTRVTGGILLAVLSNTAGDLCVFLVIMLHLG